MDRLFSMTIAAALVAGILYAEGAKMKITSPSFAAGESIPVQYTCQGKGINPALTIEDIPKEAKSLVLIVDDPDASSGTFTHWIAYDIPVTGRIDENSAPGKPGSNSAGGKGYTGPCPPAGGPHRYFFKVYALDVQLNLKEGASRSELEKAMEGHVLADGRLMAIYKKRAMAPAR